MDRPYSLNELRDIAYQDFRFILTLDLEGDPSSDPMQKEDWLNAHRVVSSTPSGRASSKTIIGDGTGRAHHIIKDYKLFLKILYTNLKEM